MIIDSHCHLDHEHLYDQIDDVIKRAELNKVNYLLTICTTKESFKKIITIIRKYKNIFGTFGIHPHESEKNKDLKCKNILDFKREHEKIIGIGESGLDFYYNHSDKLIQKKIFVEHINAAIDLDIPLIVHTRNAENETYDILRSEMHNSNLKVLIHCFTGSKIFAKKLVDLNCYISLSGIITFKNSLDLIDTVTSIPIQNLLVETDSPYLAPLPYRGKPNEPSYIIHTIEKLSQIKNLSITEVSDFTTNNFRKLFNFK